MKEIRMSAILCRRIRGLYVCYLASEGFDRSMYEDLLIAAIAYYHYASIERTIHRAPLIHQRRSIDSFADTDIPNLFRFRSKSQLWRLYRALGIGDKIVMPSRNTCSGQELFLVGIIRISSVRRLQDFEDIFGKPYNWISQVFDYFVIWMKNTHGWRVHENLPYWIPHLLRFSEAIRIKVSAISDGRLNYTVNEFKICCITDCCNQVIRRPGTGPIVDGPNADRADPAGWIQRVFYNKWLGDCQF